MEENVSNKMAHNLVLQGRKDLSVSGVLEVISFDEDIVVIKTSMGQLTIVGQDLRISKTNVQTGELVLDGKIEECSYCDTQNKNNSNGIFKRLFNRD